MNKSKLTSLIIASLLLLVLSVAGAFFIGYRYFLMDNKYTPVAEASSQKNNDDQSSDQLNGNNSKARTMADGSIALQNEKDEYNDIKQQINNLFLATKDTAGLRLSKEMQFDYEQRVEILKTKNSHIAEETKQLDLMLIALKGDIKRLEKESIIAVKLDKERRDKQLALQSQTTKQEQAPPSQQQSPKPLKDTAALAKVVPPVIKPADKPIEKPVNKPTEQGTVIASDMRIITMTGDKETGSALATQRVVCTAILENASDFAGGRDVIAELRQPGGKIVQRVKLHFDASPGEQKKVSFSFLPRDLKSGNYNLELLYKGEVIGMGSKYLQ